jgi:hypothetical protein
MVAEAAVVGIADELSGQAVNAFVALKEGNETSDQVRKDLVMQVRKSIGPFAAPKAVFVVDDLPKTRSGKIMRRILRKILSGEEDSLGDTSTVRPLQCSHLWLSLILIYSNSFPTPALWTESLRLSTLLARSKNWIHEFMILMIQIGELTIIVF